MDLENFIEQFAEQFDETDLADIRPDTYFQELEEWSSLTVMSIIAFIRTSYGKNVTGKEIRSCETVEDLYNLVESK